MSLPPSIHAITAGLGAVWVECDGPDYALTPDEARAAAATLTKAADEADRRVRNLAIEWARRFSE